jgi:hypothetical protein
MLIEESYVDVPTKADGEGTMRKYTMLPTIQLALPPLYKAIGTLQMYI